MEAKEICALLERHRYLGVNEAAIQDGIERVLVDAGVNYEREKVLGPHERLDFFVDGIAIEVKLKVSRSALIRQLSRYAQHDPVAEIIVATTSRVVLSEVPAVIHGVPVRGALLRGMF